MKPWRQAQLGIFMAVLSSLLVLGSFSLSLVESGSALALLATETPTPAPYTPGQPTFTATATPLLTETPTADPSCPFPPGWQRIQIEAWHTLDVLASIYGVTPEELAEANCLLPQSSLASLVGYNINVPPLPTPTLPPTPTRPSPTPRRATATRCVISPPAGWVLYTVRPGDNLYRLGQRFNVPVSWLKEVNCISDSDYLIAWTQIWVPYIPTNTPLPSATFPLPFTRTPTRTLPATATHTPAPTSTRTPTRTPTGSALPTHTNTATHTPAPSNTPLPTDTPVPTPVPTDTPEPYPAPISGLVEQMANLFAWVISTE
jgi:hypothetical protein